MCREPVDVRFAQPDDEPYYPINTPEDRAELLVYRELAKAEPHVLSMYDNKLRPLFNDGVDLESGGVE